MTKNEFKAKFKNAEYCGKSKTFFVAEKDYGPALKFVQHKFPPFKIQKNEDPPLPWE